MTPPAVVGYEALGRHGSLGVVVHVDESDRQEPALVVLGGVSYSLVYHVPWRCVRSVSERERRVVFELDLADFHARLREDGRVELRVAR